jgi:hypothetical protein
MRNAYRILAWGSRRKCEDNIKIELKRIMILGYEHDLFGSE